MAQPTDVFISYSSKDVAQAEALEALLEKAGLTVWRDKKRLVPGGNYVFSIHDGIENAKRVVVLWSRNSIASDYVAAEAEYARGKKKLVPVDIEACEPKVPFNIQHRLPLDIVKTEPKILLDALSGKKQEDGTYRIFSIAPEDIDTSRLPQTFSPELFGRESEMAQLYDAWDSGRSHIVALDAIGGAGKTALVRHFIQLLEEGGWRGAQRVFVWSFFSQGADANRQGDADPFYIAALTFFGYEREAAEENARNAAGRKPTQKEIAAAQLALIRGELPSPAEKGRALAGLVRAHRTLLFLDGLEPLQYPAGRNGGGKEDTAGISGALKDKGLALLLRELAADNPGLVIVTTRLKLRDLQEFRAPGVLPIPLTALAEAPAIELLQARGVTGREKHLAKLANDLRGHALALNLVAQYLVTHHGGDARRADLIPDLAGLYSDAERDPFRVMSAYEIEFKKEVARQLGTAPKWAKKLHLDRLFKLDLQTLSAKALFTAAGKQLALLYMLGLFSEPVPRKLFDALIAPPAIPGLTDGIAAADVRATQWNEAIARLRDQGLISPASAEAPGTLDCHPLVREYFGQRLAQIDRTAFKAAHSRLYDHYRYAGLPAAFREPVVYGALAIGAAFPEWRDHFLEAASRGNLPKGLKDSAPPSLITATRDQLRKTATLIGGEGWVQERLLASFLQEGSFIGCAPEWEPALASFLPKDEPGMTPLFAAIAHGCLAEREDETFKEVYLPRVARGSQFFAVFNLGLYGQELMALASFFKIPFSAPSPRLFAHQGTMLNLAGHRLRALGRLEDAAIPMRASVQTHSCQNNWKGSAVNAANLSELLVLLGRLSGEDGAIAAGASAVTFGERVDILSRVFARACLASVLLQVGSLAQAEAEFRWEEALGKRTVWQSLPGYRYCNVLLARGRIAETFLRGEYAQAIAMRNGWVLESGLDALIQALAKLTSIPLLTITSEECVSSVCEALAALRNANREDHLPAALMAHAEALWRCGDANAAAEPLHEAEDIATRGPMPLFMTQAHLLRARIALAGQGAADARPYRDRAAALIGKHGYGRAVPELAVLDAEIACAANAPAREVAIAAALAAVAGEPYHDARTGRTISGGWFGLLPRLEAILPAGHDGLAQLQAARDAYNAERDDYLRSTLTKDVEGYDPEGDPIAAYLARR